VTQKGTQLAIMNASSRIATTLSGFFLLIATAALSPGEHTLAVAAQNRAPTVFPIDHADLVVAPYVWKVTGKGAGTRAEATMPGAYVKAAFRGSTAVGLILDGSVNRGCPASSMPVVEFSIDEGPFKAVPLSRAENTYVLSMGSGLNAEATHRVEVFFRAADLTQKRWESSMTHLCIAGFALDAGASLLPQKARARKSIAFGDSITEGVGAVGLFTSWQLLGVNSARETWFPIVCAALDCEYGQLGSGGLGMTRTLNMPPLPKIWHHYDPATSRLTGGLLLPEPDYVVCSLGTNDFEKEIAADYTRWLAEMRKACPTARIFCIVPTLGVHKKEIEAAVGSRKRAGDLRVYLIDPAPVAKAFRSNTGATQLAYDGVHPSVYGHAILAAFIAAEIQKVLSLPN
jgi:lysophospholipase L1-like esterase